MYNGLELNLLLLESLRTITIDIKLSSKQNLTPKAKQKQ